MKQNFLYLMAALAITMLMPNLSWAKSKKASEWPIEIFEAMDNSKLVIFIKDKDIEVSPVWFPAKGGPPMGIAAVLNKVNKWVEEDPSLNGLGVSEIELKPINRHKNHWYYLVQLKSLTDVKMKPSYVAVLFTGKVVPAMVEPASIK